MRLLRWMVPVVVLAAAVTLCVVFGRGLIHLLGIDTQQSDNYDFVSGVGPMIVTVLLGSSVLVGVWRAVNCHVDGCPRIGRYHVAGGRFKVCRAHHPEDAVRQGKVEHHHIIAWHREHSP